MMGIIKMENNEMGRSNKTKDECSGVCEVLVREISHARRWSAILDARLAILKVRQMARSLIAEQNGFFDKSTNCPGKEG